jgi:hypothetical protein
MIFDGIDSFVNEPMRSSYNKLKKTLIDYYRHNTDINYGFGKIGDVQVVFITGKNNEEESIASFITPYAFKTVTDKYILFVDVRPYARKKLDGLNNIDEMMVNKTGFDGLMLYVKLYAEHLSGFTKNKQYIEETIKIMSTALSAHIGQGMRANVNDVEEFKILLAYYFSNLTNIYDTKEENLILTAKTTIGVRNVSRVQELIGDFEGELKNTNDLITLIEYCISGTRLANIDRTSFILASTAIVFGEQLRRYMTISLEDPIMFTTVFYIVMNNRLFSKTQLFGILRQQKHLKTDEYLKTIEKIKEL